MNEKDLQRATDIVEALNSVDNAIKYTKNNFLIACKVEYIVNNAKLGRLEIHEKIQKDFTIAMHNFLKAKKIELEKELKLL